MSGIKFNMAGLAAKVARLEKQRVQASVTEVMADEGLEVLDWRVLSGMDALPSQGDRVVLLDGVQRRPDDPRNDLDLKLHAWREARIK